MYKVWFLSTHYTANTPKKTNQRFIYALSVSRGRADQYIYIFPPDTNGAVQRRINDIYTYLDTTNFYTANILQTSHYIGSVPHRTTKTFRARF